MIYFDVLLNKRHILQNGAEEKSGKRLLPFWSALS